MRRKSWVREDVYKVLRDRNVAMVWTENQYLKSPAAVTADSIYLRMVGDRELTEFKETQRDKSAEMREWYKALDGASDSVKGPLVVFNHHYADFGPARLDDC